MSKVKKVVPYVAGVGLLIAGVCLIKKKISVKNVQSEVKEESDIKSLEGYERHYIKLR